MSVRNSCLLMTLCVVLFAVGTATSSDVAKQPWRAAVDPEGVTAEPAPPFEATEAVVFAESFDDAAFPPAGWGQAYVSGAFDWDRQTAGTFPTIETHSGAGMARWNCFNISSGNSTRLYGPVMDLSTASSPSLHFWMSHDTGYPTSDDRIVVQLSTDSGSTWTDLGTISRYDAACGTPCWQEHVFAVPSQAGVVFGLLGISEYGSNIFVDDVTIQEPAPNLSTSTKSAPSAALQADEIIYTVDIVNSGGGPAGAATLVDPIPPLTSYVPTSLTCTSGTCVYNDVADQIEWSGSVPAAGTVTVTFEVDTDLVPCDSMVTNTAVIDDPDLVGDPVTVEATTRVVYTLAALDESFTDAAFPPVGWTEEILVDPGTDPDWSRVTSGTSPTIAPHTDPAMAKFNSYNTQATGSARLASPSFDMTGFTMPTLSFWMSHDTGYSTTGDLIQAQVSTDAGMTWDDVGDPVLRYDATCSTACWLEHNVDLSAYIGLTDVRVALVGVSGYGNNIYVDDVVVAEPWYPCPSVSLEPDSIGGGCEGDVLDYQLTVTNGFSTTDTLEITSSSSWPVTIDQTMFTLGVGESAVANVSVPIPFGVGPGDFDIATFTVTGLASGLTDTADIRTFVYIAATYTDYADVPDTPTNLRSRDHGLVYYDGKLYKFGGYTGTASAAVGVYDIATDTWSTADDMPGARYYIDCVEIGGKMYCGGGYSTSGQTTLYIFDPSAPAGSQWTTGAPLPAYRYAYAGVALDGKYYLLGGYASGITATCIVYDPVTDTWDSIPNMEVPRRYPLAGAIGGKIVVTGGLSGGASTESYDPNTNTWTSLAPNPFGGWVRTADGVLDDQYLIIAGGYPNDATASNYVIAYDAVNDLWDVPQGTMPHLIYGAEGDTDGDGNFWFVSGRLYEGGTFSYSNYTVKVGGCPPPSADLAVVKDDGVDQVAPGDPVTYTITVSNLGPFPVAGANVVDSFPAAFLNASWTCAGTGGATCTAGPVSGNINDLADIPPGESVVYTATGDVSATDRWVLVDGRPALVNTASVYPPAGVTDPDLTNNSSTDVDEVGTVADVAIFKDDGVTEVMPGDPVTYTITVTNAGPNDADTVIVTDSFPASITGVTWTCVGSGGGGCSPAGAGNLVDVATVPNGGSLVYTATGTVSPGATGTIDNTAEVMVVSATDPNLANNSSTDSDTVVAEVDLAITKTDFSCYVLPGGTTTYTITVTNAGPSTAVDAVVVDTFPADIDSVTWTCVASGGASCTPSGTGDINDIVTVPVAGSLVYSAVATVDAFAGGYLVNTANVEAAAGVTDTDLTNNESTDTNALELPVFCDGFESGTTDAWSSVVP